MHSALEVTEILYSDYKFDFQLVSSPNPNLGDFYFRWEGANPSYIQEETGMRIALSIIMLGAAIVFTWRMRRVPFRHWTMEQSWGIALAFSLAVSDNALYPLQAFTATLFWPLLFSMFEGTFISLFYLFCLLYELSLSLFFCVHGVLILLTAIVFVGISTCCVCRSIKSCGNLQSCG